MSIENLLGLSLMKTCPNSGGSGRPIHYPWVSCEPCDGSGWLPSRDGRELLDVLGLGVFRIEASQRRR